MSYTTQMRRPLSHDCPDCRQPGLCHFRCNAQYLSAVFRLRQGGKTGHDAAAPWKGTGDTVRRGRLSELNKLPPSLFARRSTFCSARKTRCSTLPKQRFPFPGNGIYSGSRSMVAFLPEWKNILYLREPSALANTLTHLPTLAHPERRSAPLRRSLKQRRSGGPHQKGARQLPDGWELQGIHRELRIPRLRNDEDRHRRLPARRQPV